MANETKARRRTLLKYLNGKTETAGAISKGLGYQSVRRTLRSLENGKLVQRADGVWSVTSEGQEWLAGQGVAAKG